jgi:integrase
MPTVKLTEKSVEILPTGTGKQVLFWDTELSGFGVLCSGVTDAKTYIAQARLRNGNRRRITIGRCDRLKVGQARDKARELLAQMALGEDPKAKSSALTLEEAFDRYLASRKSLKDSSKDDYRTNLKHLDDWRKKTLGEITPDMVEARHALIAEETQAAKKAALVKARRKDETRKNEDPSFVPPTRPEVSPRAGHALANKTMRVFRAIYNHAEARNDDLPTNPVRRLKRNFYKVPRRDRVIKFEQFPAFFAALDDLDNTIAADYIKFLLFTGLRRREAAALKWSEIDFGNKTFTIPGAKTKNGKSLTLPMSDLVHALLVKRRAVGKSGDDFVFFANSKSGHIEEPKFAFDQVEAATGIKSSPHDLRRAYATTADSCELSTLAIRALMNHAPPSDVTSGYIILSAERLRRPAELVAAKIRELCQIEMPAGENVAALKR